MSHQAPMNGLTRRNFMEVGALFQRQVGLNSHFHMWHWQKGERTNHLTGPSTFSRTVLC